MGDEARWAAGQTWKPRSGHMNHLGRVPNIGWAHDSYVPCYDSIEFQSNFNSPEGKSRLIIQFYLVIATSLRTMGDLKAMCQRGDRTTGNVANSIGSISQVDRSTVS